MTDHASSASSSSTVSTPRAARGLRGLGPLALLGWIAAIKATGLALATLALVQATSSLGLSAAGRGLAASAVSLVIAATAIAAGLAADRLGRRRVLMGSFVIAAVGNLSLFVAPTPVLYIAGLAVSGVGYGIMFTGSYAYVKAVAPGQGLGWALGLFGMFASVLAAITCSLGGALADVDWRLLFLVVPVMCAIAALLTPRLLPVMPTVGSGPVDGLGLVLLGAGMVLVLTGLSQVTSPASQQTGLLLVVGGVAAFTAWVLVERRSAHPSFPLSVFRSGPFVAAGLIGIAVNIASSMVVLSLSDVWQYIDDASVLGVSFGLEPIYIVGTLGGVLAGHRLSAGVHPRLVVVVGCAVSIVGFLALVPLNREVPYVAFLPGTVLLGCGLAAVTTAQSQVIVHQAPPAHYGAVTSSKTSMGQLGSALGMILTVLMIDTITNTRLMSMLEGSGESASASAVSVARLDAWVNSNGSTDSSGLAAAITDATAAFGTAYQAIMVAAAVILAIAAALAWVLMRDPAPAPSGVVGSADGHK